MRQTDQTSGGLDLAHRYGLAHGIGSDRYWADLSGLYRAGWAEQAVRPAPGRKAVYRLCLRMDAIPADLPEDLTRALRPWALPEPADVHEDSVYGRLTGRRAVPMQHGVLQLVEGVTAYEMAAAVQTAPRWEHPADSAEAEVAARIRETSKALPQEDRVALEPAYAVAADEPQTSLAERLSVQWAGVAKRLPYTRGVSQLCGLLSADRTGLVTYDEMAKTTTTPSAAPGKKPRRAVAADLSSAVEWVVRRAWASWRAQLGYREVILPKPSDESASRSLTGSKWGDLQRVVGIALRRGATPTQLVELMTSNLIKRDQWGHETWRVTSVSQLAAHRLWRWINAHPDAPHYTRRPTVAQAAHVTAWDNPTPAELAARLARARQAQDAQRTRIEALALEAEARAAARQRRRDAERAELADRWGLDRYAQPAQEPAARRDEVEAERLSAVRRRARAKVDPGDRSRAAAIERARAERRERRRREGWA
ncbi:hypothetical protein [Streptomyces sp. NPDC001492]